MPMQDLFGWRDRINTPATVGPHNWTWRLPWPIDAVYRYDTRGIREFLIGAVPDPEMEKKGTPASPAFALASRVLPTPVGPENR